MLQCTDAFYYTNLARLDLSKATSLVEIGENAFPDTTEVTPLILTGA